VSINEKRPLPPRRDKKKKKRKTSRRKLKSNAEKTKDGGKNLLTRKKGFFKERGTIATRKFVAREGAGKGQKKKTKTKKKKGGGSTANSQRNP